MGQGKTGTTALQHALHAARAPLAAHGILYPALARGAVAHHLLIALCEADERIPPHVSAPYGGPNEARALAAAALYHLRQEVEQLRPEILVLSSETFIHGLRAEAKRTLARLLAPLSQDIQPVIYVREPASLYRSRLQERMRATATPLPPAAQEIRCAIEEAEAAFRPPVVCAYDPAQLSGGDIVSDFANRFLADRIDPAMLPARRDNPSLSAEAILLLSRFRALVAGDQDWQKEPLSDRLFSQLRKLERACPNTATPQLWPGVADAVRRASMDYLWLRDRYGVRFPDLDYAAIDGAPVARELAAASLADLIEVSEKRYEALLLKVLVAEMQRAD